jgi:hypothetical protein
MVLSEFIFSFLLTTCDVCDYVVLVGVTKSVL